MSDDQSLPTQPTEKDSRIFPCTQCGADVEFHIGTQQMRCPYCGHKTDLTHDDEEVRLIEKDYLEMLDELREIHNRSEESQIARKNAESLQEVRCESCGGTVVFHGTLTSSKCPYCATPIQLNNVHESKVRVPTDGVLPFQIEKDRASSNLKQWVGSRWFAPNQFKKQGIKGVFNGVYLPFWTFDSMTGTVYRGKRGETYTVTVGSGKNRRTETRVRWYPASGEFERFFDDVLVVAARGVAGHLISKLSPWPLHKCIPFNPQALAGFLARTYDVELDRGFELGRGIIDSQLRSDVKRRIGGDRQIITSMKSDYHAVTYKHVLLPTWLLTYKFNNKIFHVVVNGATGEVQGDRPYSWMKIFFAVLAGAIVAGGIALLANLK